MISIGSFPKLFLGIVVVALISVLTSGAYWYSLSDLLAPLGENNVGHDDTESAWVGRALSLLDHGTLDDYGAGEADQKGIVLRGPGYPVVLATSFLIVGKRVIGIVGANFILFAAALFCLWCISRRLLPEGWALLPSLLLALFWEPASLVWISSYEMFSLFLTTFFILTLLNYRESQHYGWLAGAAVVFGIYVLERPVVLYFAPVVLFFIVAWHLNSAQKKAIFLRAIIFTLIFSVIVGAWAVRNFKTLGTGQLGSGGLILLRRASQTSFTTPELISMTLSFAVGDYIGSRIYDGYPKDAKPKTWDPAINRRLESSGFMRGDWRVKDVDGSVISRIVFDRRLYQEAKDIIKAKPVRFFITGFPNLLRLNSPMNYGGQEIMHLFVGSRGKIPAYLKIAIILFIRTVWYVFLALVVYGIFRHIWKWPVWGFLAVVIFYYNFMYSFFTHAEVRYVLTVMPLYFLFFVAGVRVLWLRHFTFRT